MSAEAAPITRPSSPEWFASGQHAVFTGRNLRIGASSIVHAVADVPWLGDLTLPAPACRQGYAGTGTHGELRPTRWPVTCRRCRRLPATDNGEQPAQQPALFPLPHP